MENTEEDESKMSLSALTAPIKRVQDKHKMLPHFLRMRGLLRQYTDSFNYFINTEMKQIVEAKSNKILRSKVDANWFLEYTDIYVGEPNIQDGQDYVRVTPFECRLRDCTYAAPLYVNVRYVLGNKILAQNRVEIGRMPIMLRSDKCVLNNKTEEELAAFQECSHDPGGYFIIKGTEKVILMQEQLSKNRVIIELDSKENISAAITSSTHERKSRCNIFFKNNKVYVKSNIIEMPIVVILKAMGVESDQEIVQLVGMEADIVDLFSGSLEESYTMGIYSKKQALKHIGEEIQKSRAEGYRKDDRRSSTPETEAIEMLAHSLLNHVPVVNYDFSSKVVYIAHIVRRVLKTVMDPTLIDDKDYYGNKRIELPGSQISVLFEDSFKTFNSIIQTEADKELIKQNRVSAFNVINSIKRHTNLITEKLVFAISTGNWVIRRFRMDRAGITQVLSRLSYISALGMMTRVQSHYEKTRKVAGPRSLQTSQWGMICPADTPEGEACGLVKNLALLAHVTNDEDSDVLHRICVDLGVEDASLLSGEEINSHLTYLIFLNGLIIGAHAKPEELAQKIRSMRRRGKVGEFVSVYLNKIHKAVYVSSDGGRVCRPLLIVEKGRLKLTQKHIERLGVDLKLEDMLADGIVEYVDVNEENNCLIALDEDSLTPDHTHTEIDPLTILGVVCGLVPYPHHNQSPRNTYQCAMGKQAIGTTAMNQYERFDSLLYSMVYPQKPLVKSRTLDLVNFDKLPGGQNASLCVMSYSGYDIEDAVVINRGSIDRGFGRCLVVRKYQTSIKSYTNNGTMDSTQGPPISDDPRLIKKYSALDIDGICQVGEVVESGSILVNKFVPSNANEETVTPGNISVKPSPLSYKGAAACTVNKVLITSSESEKFVIKVLAHQVRRPEVGDKFSSRHGQKGVCGLILNQEDMPFSDAGICPDLIMNPHGFPSRMTVGKMVEIVAGKAGVFEGRQAYGSAFGEKYNNADKVEDCCKLLVEHGYSYHGKDSFTSGITGQPLQGYVFAGPVFYQKLKHMVMDKMHARAKGPRASLTRQPTEGRSRDGGLRLGEMERDCLVGYGASNLLMERLMISSDAFVANVCESCGLLGYEGWCQRCRSGDKISSVRLPYACKLLFQELQSMNIATRLTLQEF